MATTALTVFPSTTASAYITKSNQLGTGPTGGATSNKNTTISTSTGWVEACSQGASPTFAGSIGTPSGHGWLLDSAILETMQTPVGNWTPSLQFALSTTGASITADIHVRAFVYDTSLKTYTQIGSDMVYAGAVINQTSAQNFVFSATSLPTQAFLTGQRLYIDIWLNITVSTGTSSSPATVLRTQEANSVLQGSTTIQIVTPGYQVATIGPPAIVAASGFNDTTSPFGAFYGIWQFQAQDTNVPPYTSAYNADPANGTVTNPPTFTSNSNAANPQVFGAVAAYTWSQLEQVEGTRNWTLIENDITWWAAQGKQVQLRVTAGSTAKNDSSVPHFGKTCYKATPQWVFTAGAASVTVTGTGTVNDGVNIYPVYWDTTFLAKYQNFINAFAAQYDGDPRIHSIMLGLGCFGEATMDESGGTTAQKLAYWQPAGYTQDTWTSTYTTIMGYYKTAFKSTPLTVGCNSTYIDSDSTHNMDNLIAVCLSKNIWLQDNGLVNKLSYPQNIQHHSNPAWVVQPNLEEQLKATTQSGSTLADDMNQNTQFGGLVCMIYTADINNALYASVLAQYVQAVTKPHASGAVVAQAVITSTFGSGILV